MARVPRWSQVMCSRGIGVTCSTMETGRTIAGEAPLPRRGRYDAAVTFVHPWLGLLAAGIGVPLLLLLYFLKLRRQTMRIPSTLLWRSSFEDLQVNVPFQRLRWSLLLFLQLLLVLLIAGAIAQPRIAGELDAPSRLIVLLDQSASMGARAPGDRTRLDLAKEAAIELSARLSESSDAKSMMVVSFGASPRVVIGFESNRRALEDAITSIEQTDEPANLEAALRLAGAFAQRGETTDDGESEDNGAGRPGVVLIGDGGVGKPSDAAGFRLRAGSFRFIPIATSARRDGADERNVGIVSCSARRSMDDASKVLLFVRLVNSGEQAVDVVVTVRLDDAMGPLRRMQIPGATEAGPGESAQTIELNLPGGAVIMVSHNVEDDLASDDVAAVVMPEPNRPRILIVQKDGQPDPFLHELLDVTQPRELRVIERDAYESGAVDASQFDVIVFDRVSGHALPSTASLTVGGVPAGVEQVAPRTGGGKRITSWLRQHPMMRYASLDTLVYAGFGGMMLPSAAEALATGPDGPVMALLRSRSARHVVVGFALAQSNWPTHVSLAVFVQNVLDALLASNSGQWGRVIRPGEPSDVRVSPGSSELTLHGPVNRTILIRAGEERVTVPGLPRVGLYEIVGAVERDAVAAVSLLDDSESDIRPRETVPVSAQTAGQMGGESAGQRDVWPWVVMGALAVAVLEWIAYLWRLRI